MACRTSCPALRDEGWKIFSFFPSFFVCIAGLALFTVLDGAIVVDLEIFKIGKRENARHRRIRCVNTMDPSRRAAARFDLLISSLSFSWLHESQIASHLLSRLLIVRVFNYLTVDLISLLPTRSSIRDVPASEHAA